jgi:hypothetical protein
MALLMGCVDSGAEDDLPRVEAAEKTRKIKINKAFDFPVAQGNMTSNAE